MNDLDDERAVFFCGAGISRGRESGLPGFLGLVKHIYKTNHLSPDAVERDALDCDEENPERRKPKLDKVLDLLERPERLGPSDLRRCDPGWTREHLIPRLDPAHPAEEAQLLWAAYAQSRKVGPDLLAAFRDSFLRILKSVERVSHHRDGLVGLFVVVCLETPNELAEKETRDVVDSFSDEALQTVLDSLKQHLNGNAEERARIWQCVIDPWLEHYWPKEGARNTTETSEAMLRLLLECGDAFPMAVERFSDRMKPVAGHRLYALKNSQHVSRHPDSVFRLLKHVVRPASFQHGHKHFVRKLLEELEQASPVLGEDREFQEMYRQATS